MRPQAYAENLQPQAWLLGRSNWQRTVVADGNVQQLKNMERQVFLSGLLGVRAWRVASAITTTVYGAQV